MGCSLNMFILNITEITLKKGNCKIGSAADTTYSSETRRANISAPFN